MVCVVRPPLDTLAVERIVALNPVVTRWEMFLTVEELEQYPVSKALTGEVWLSTPYPPTPEQSKVAERLGVTGWLWSQATTMEGGGSTKLKYRCRPEASLFSRPFLAAFGKEMVKRGGALNPYWVNPDPLMDLETLAQVSDVPIRFLQFVQGGVPPRCKAPSVLEVQSGWLKACPFRNIPRSEAEHTPSAMVEIKRSGFPCPHGCFYPHPVLADDRWGNLGVSPQDVSAWWEKAEAPKWVVAETLRHVPIRKAYFKGHRQKCRSAEDAEHALRTVLTFLLSPFKTGSVGWREFYIVCPQARKMTYEVFLEWERVGAWGKMEVLLRTNWPAAKEADWGKAPNSRTATSP